MFTPEQEWQLAGHLKELDKRFYGITRKQLMSLAYEFAVKNKIEHKFNRTARLAGLLQEAKPNVTHSREM
jgi:hypothetical protein